jgi:hypothetical protein
MRRNQARESANAAHFTASFSGHDDDFGAGKLEVRRLEEVMIGERVAPGVDSEAREVVEEAVGIADAGDGVHRVPANGHRELRDAALLPSRDRDEALGIEAHRKARRPWRGVGEGPGATGDVDHDRIHFGKARHRLAQRPRRQHEPVAVEALSVDDGNLHVAFQCVVLQAVVGHEDVHFRVRREERARGGRAIGRDEDRNLGTARDEHRLVAEMLGCGELRVDAHDAQRILLAAAARGRIRAPRRRDSTRAAQISTRRSRAGSCRAAP